MLHGWTLDHRSWSPQLPLAEHARLVLPDRRGFGRSSAPADLANEWRDIDRFAGPDRFVLVGLSQGASVALDYARHRPERLLALVVVGTPLHGIVPVEEEETPIPRARFAGMIARGELTAMKAEWETSLLVRTMPAAYSLLDKMLGDYDGRDLLDRSGPIDIGVGDIAALSMPVLAVVGTGDTGWRRRVAAFIAQTAPHGRLAKIDGAGHLCNFDNPVQFNAILSDVIDSSLR